MGGDSWTSLAASDWLVDQTMTWSLVEYLVLKGVPVVMAWA